MVAQPCRVYPVFPHHQGARFRHQGGEESRLGHTTAIMCSTWGLVRGLAGRWLVKSGEREFILRL